MSENKNIINSVSLGEITTSLSLNSHRSSKTLVKQPSEKRNRNKS